MAKHMFVHFLQRIKERYGIELTLEDLKSIAEQIKSGRAKITKMTSHSYQYKVRAQGKQLIVVLNRNHSYFITALPYNKYTDKVTFSGMNFKYEDALYATYLLKKMFGIDKIDKQAYCKKCHSSSYRIELDKGRFKCMNCHDIIKIKDLEEPLVQLCTITKQGFEPVYHLSEDFWWYLYKNDYQYNIEGTIVDAVLIDNDKMRYSINNKAIVHYGYYTLEQLKEKTNGNKNVSRP